MSSSSSGPFHNWQITCIKQGMIAENRPTGASLDSANSRFYRRILAGLPTSARIREKIEHEELAFIFEVLSGSVVIPNYGNKTRKRFHGRHGSACQSAVWRHHPARGPQFSR